MNVIYVKEENPPKGIEPVEWFLMTNEPAGSGEEAYEKPYTIAEAVKYVGWLGGPKTAPGDGPPGFKTIWRGLQKLYTLLDYRELFDFAGQV
jgi:hypothetical protein